MNAMDSRAASSERAVIGALMVKPESAADAIDLLEDDYFMLDETRAVFGVAKRLHEQGKPIDTATIIAQSAPELKTFILQCAETVPSIDSDHVRQYAEYVLSAWRCRQMYTQIIDAANGCSTGDAPEDVCEKLAAIVTEQEKYESAENDRNVHSAQKAVIEWLQRLQTSNDDSLKCGMAQLDYMLAGFQPGRLYTLSARSGRGKSDLALCIATNISRKAPVLYVSMEMDRNELLDRIISRLGKVNSRKLQNKKELTEEERDSIAAVTNSFYDTSKLVIDDGGAYTVETIARRVRKLRPSMVVIDHLQIMSAEKARRQKNEEIEHTMAALKILAMKQKIVVLLLSQESRIADRGGGSPQMSDLIGSSAIEADSDVVMFVHPETSDAVLTGDESKHADLHIVKNRSGSTGKIGFRWQPQYHRWMEEMED